MSKRRGHDFNDVRTNQRGDQQPSIRDQIDQFKFPPDKFVTVRIISPVFMYAGYWVATKKKDGSPGKFYMPSPSYDPESQSFDSTVYDPFYEISKGERGVDRDNRLIQVQKYGYCNAIIMHEEARRPERIPRPTEQELKTGFKEKDSDSWTPVKVLRLSSTMMEQIQGIAQTNIVTNKATGEQKAMSIAHPRFGMTIRIKHSPKKPAASQYQILPGERMPLNERQQKYLTWDLSDLERPEPEDRVRENYERWAEKMGLADASDGDDGFDDDQNPGRSRRPVKKVAVKKAARRPQQEESWDEGGDEGSEGWDDHGGDGSEGWGEPAPQQRRPVKKAVKKAARRAPPADEGWEDSGGSEGDWDESDDGGDAAGWTEDDASSEVWDEGGDEGSWEDDGGWEDDGSGTEEWSDGGDGTEAEGGDEGWDESDDGGEAPWEDDSSGDDDGWEQPPSARRPVKKAARPQQRPVKKAVKKAARRPAHDDWS